MMHREAYLETLKDVFGLGKNVFVEKNVFHALIRSGILDNCLDVLKG